jgi:hypothetical protein
MESMTQAIGVVKLSWVGTLCFNTISLLWEGTRCHSNISCDGKIAANTVAKGGMLHEALWATDLFTGAATVPHVEVLHPVAEETLGAHTTTWRVAKPLLRFSAGAVGRGRTVDALAGAGLSVVVSDAQVLAVVAALCWLLHIVDGTQRTCPEVVNVQDESVLTSTA